MEPSGTREALLTLLRNVGKLVAHMFSRKNIKAIPDYIYENLPAVLGQVTEQLRWTFTRSKIFKSTAHDFARKKKSLVLLCRHTHTAKKKAKELLTGSRKREKTGLKFTRNCVSMIFLSC
ncbi:hypothetical protein BCV72DRAFT_324916 [Rhizopus microsporus var. microsporus]|uniref:Uncharacterized protein n=1 Tax=Rhizopus microsporus var. microsporus TaxID=86635 RepID=A0A1X0QM29_RHIZD|nr:hypothetical protein BCV72DRAFT_324916 [Rhizopus microsporus var. microsporus]